MYGRAGDLLKLSRDRNNPNLPKYVRMQADKAHAQIVSQLKDKKLMRLRLQLINAAKANDMHVATKIEQQMRFHVKEDRETGV